MNLEAWWALLLTGCMRGGVYALMAAGLSLIFGVMNIAQFAHGEFYMLGAYIAYFIFRVAGLNPLLAIAVAGFLGFAAGVLVERAVYYPLRVRARQQWVMNTFLVTVGLSFALQNSAQAIWGGNYFGITRYWETSVRLGAGMAIPTDRIISFSIAIFVILSLGIFLKLTQAGRAIRAVAQDEVGAMMVGVDLDRIRALTSGLSTMLAAIAGASLLWIVPAHPTMGAEPLYKSWYVVILGGLGSVSAAIPAGFLVGMIETFAYYAFGASWQNVASLCLIILILLVKPSGLFGGEVKGIWER